MNIQRVGVISFLVLIILAGAGSVFYTLYRLRNHDEFLSDKAPTAEQVEKAKGQVITLTETRDGHRRWVLKMKEIKYSKDKNVANLVDVQGLVYGDKEKVMFTFKAPKGLYYKEKTRIVLDEGANMRFPEADVVMQAPHMDWSSETGMVSATGGVQMTKKNFGVTRANKALFAMDFSTVRFEGNASSVLGGHSNTGD